MATPRKRRPSFDAPAAAAPEASAWAYRTDPTAPATPPAPPKRTVSSTALSTPVSTPSVLNRLVTTPVMLAALIVLMPLSLLGRPAKPR
jgi:hypothetical protein